MLLLGVAALLVVLWAMQVASKADPQKMAKGAKAAGGVAALAGACLLATRGALQEAIPLGLLGFGLLGWYPGLPAAFSSRSNKSPGGISRVRSAFVEMELDHDSGTMQGRILAGPYEGTTLDALSVRTLMRLAGEVDEESRALLAAYLDRREPRWREHGENGSAAGRNGPAPSGGPMTAEEAYQVLGLQPGADAATIGRAHRSLMKKLHPDQGGSTYLAARVNQAKDVLLRRHR
jgi:hypothetical protein